MMVYCKYDKEQTIEADVQCAGCLDFLCSSCGYTHQDKRYCNDCYENLDKAKGEFYCPDCGSDEWEVETYEDNYKLVTEMVCRNCGTTKT